MGITKIDTSEGQYVTASCTACHAESLFGRPIIGLTNKTPRANKAFEFASQIVPKVPATMIKLMAKATPGEVNMWKKMQDTFQWIGVKEPQVLGLDTSLATVALSLSKRSLDPHASITRDAYKNPRYNALEKIVSDSKPLPWFALKYKTRWLADGSVVSGNPILTNILWNEIGRGVDLQKLSSWLEEEPTKKKVVELTAAVFATEPPRYTDFFHVSTINLEKARRGQALFNQSCFKCHGTYEKAWDQEDIAGLSAKELLETTKVNYPNPTVVKDVGTDPNRYLAMAILAPDLNRLKISEQMGIKVIPQKGYVPPPLVGIWSRWPYFHNNSAPTLCDVLSKPETRRMKWYVGSPVNPATDFDSECNGFPEISKAPKEWRKKDQLFDARKPGLTNIGHYKEDYTKEEKSDLIAFLKTL
jgi:cytochrome c2